MQSKVVAKDESRKKKFDTYWAKEVKVLFNDIAERYDEANEFISFGYWSRLRQKFVGRMDIRENGEVLDVCAGTNAVGIDLLAKNPTLKVTAVDRSHGMQETGAERAKAKGLEIKSVISDVHKLPFEDESYDGATMEAATRHLKVKIVFAEVYRVLKPGASFYHHDLIKPRSKVVTFFYFNFWRLMIPITTWAMFRSTKFLGVRQNAYDLGKYFIEAIHMFFTADELTAIMKEVGFKEVEVKTMVGGTVGYHKATK